MNKLPHDWINATGLPSRSFICGYCGENISSFQGFHTSGGTPTTAYIYICHVCMRPTFFFQNEQSPGSTFGTEVKHLQRDVEALYRQARDCMSVSAFTAAVLLCRKILMNVAVDLVAQTNLNIINYVKYLSDPG